MAVQSSSAARRRVTFARSAPTARST
jgi:hypothetical protein